MSSERRSRPLTLVRLGALACAFAALPLAALLLLKEPQAAEAAPVLSAESAAVHKTKDNKLWVAVSLTNGGDKALKGTLRVELLDADETVLAADEKTVDQPDKTSSYRFEFPAEGRETRQADAPLLLRQGEIRGRR